MIDTGSNAQASQNLTMVVAPSNNITICDVRKQWLRTCFPTLASARTNAYRALPQHERNFARRHIIANTANEEYRPVDQRDADENQY